MKPMSWRLGSIARRGATFLLGLSLLSAPLAAKDGREVYEETCNKCHGLITEESSWNHFLKPGVSEVDLAVILARGPTLNGIVGRPAAIIPNYAYSKAMRAFGEEGGVWDRETLDKYLTNSRAMIKGFMVVKLGPEDRKLVLDYLTNVANYQP